MSGATGTIAVLDYGIGNLASAHRALLHLGADARLVRDPEAAADADGVVLPGVGAFGRCASALEESGLGAVARRALEDGTPFLGICVGLQLLYEGSEEASGVTGFGALAGTVQRLAPGVKCPQMQWNPLLAVGPEPSAILAGLPDEPWMYFVHSYAPPVGAETVAVCEYGGPVAAAIERGHIWGTQFHPEKSGTLGLAVLANFVERVGARSVATGV
ncbi:MAG: imidazole glycerol phosphate synthase subunit HisH [Acidimicrobiales bacterium]